MGFASGLPLLLTLTTLSYWLSTMNVDKTTIGLFLFVQTPYAYKFLWSPIMDRCSCRSWGLCWGDGAVGSSSRKFCSRPAIFAMGQTDPIANGL